MNPRTTRATSNEPTTRRQRVVSRGSDCKGSRRVVRSHCNFECTVVWECLDSDALSRNWGKQRDRAVRLQPHLCFFGAWLGLGWVGSSTTYIDHAVDSNRELQPGSPVFMFWSEPTTTRSPGLPGAPGSM